MLGIPRRYAHYVFGVLQSGLTSAIATGVASLPFLHDGSFAARWAQSFGIAWATMLPVVVLAAPAIRRLANGLTRA